MKGFAPGKLAIVIGARTEHGRQYIGKTVTLEMFIPKRERIEYRGKSLFSIYDCWVVSGDITSHLGYTGWALYANNHLMPIEGDNDQFVKEQDKELEKV